MSIFFVAEIGINHNGSMNICKQLIDLAVESGCDAVKFQKREVEDVYSKKFLESFRDSPWGKTQRDQKEGLEFNETNYSEIDRYCKDLNIQWFASAWDLKSLTFLDKFNTKYNKIASAMIVDLNFLTEVAKRGKHTFISTGMSELKNIDDAVNIFKKHNCPFELMHCISVYPLDPKDVHLRTMNSLKKRYDCDVGYSGHENGITISLAAVVLGASSIERHITLDRTMYGSDQAASIELSGMKNLTEQIDKYLLAYGEDMIGKVLEDEIPIAKKLREHLKI
jgi:N-acetylneuraminate synthase